MITAEDLKKKLIEWDKEYGRSRNVKVGWAALSLLVIGVASLGQIMDDLQAIRKVLENTGEGEDLQPLAVAVRQHGQARTARTARTNGGEGLRYEEGGE